MLFLANIFASTDKYIFFVSKNIPNLINILRYKKINAQEHFIKI